jgi:hypothetical protein
MRCIVAIALVLAVAAGSAMAQSDRGRNNGAAGTVGSRDGGAGIAPGSGTGHADQSQSSPDGTTGSAGRATGDQAVDQEDKLLERRLHSICKGC